MADNGPLPAELPVDTRRRRILDAAFTVFARLGYRKASMDEVARVAQVSRQGLYLHFSTKEDLFRETVSTFLMQSQAAAQTALAAADRPLEERLVQAFDALMCPAIETKGAEIGELLETTRALLGSLVEDQTAIFLCRLEAAIEASPELMTPYRAAGLSARQLASSLYATAHGLKFMGSTRADFLARITDAVRIVCLPLRAKD